MALIPKVEPKQEKKIVSARLDEQTHAMLQQYGEFLGDATHDYIIAESLKRLFRRDREFKDWLEKRQPNPRPEVKQRNESVEGELQVSKAKARVA
jgi:hypothetical protein